MSGHSKWAQIRHQKGLSDLRRGQLFSKLARLISVAAREGGNNPSTNSKLRMAIEKAKAYNMPSDNIERAIKKGTGELSEGALEEVMYEAYGSSGVAILIRAITDNKNRTTQELKHILNNFGGKLAEPGSVQFLFERRGVMQFAMLEGERRQSLELAAIEAGAQDLKERGEVLEIITSLEDLEKAKRAMYKAGFEAQDASIDFIPKSELVLNQPEKDYLEELLSKLDEHDDVQEIYTNSNL